MPLPSTGLHQHLDCPEELKHVIFLLNKLPVGIFSPHPAQALICKYKAVRVEGRGWLGMQVWHISVLL